MTNPGLDNPEYARFAWGRYWRLQRWLAAVALLAVPVALAAMTFAMGPLELHMTIAVSLAVFFSIWMASALMGLVFMSSGTGHDEAAGERFERDQA